jgi:cation diffusion facilitator family transporter
MLAEAAHSVADSLNQIFLWLSLAFSERPPDPEHPFGHGKDRFFWSFLAAVVIFLSGAVFSIARGALELSGRTGSDTHRWTLGYGVLAFSLVAEGASLARALQQTRGQARAKGLPLGRYVGESRDLTTKTVLFEDSAAATGVLFAFAGIAVHEATGYAAAVAFTIGAAARHFLLGVGARPEEREGLRQAICSFSEVEQVTELLTMYLHPESLLVAAKIDFADGLDAERIELLSNEIEQAMRRTVPEVWDVFLDPTPSRGRARPGRRAVSRGRSA